MADAPRVAGKQTQLELCVGQAGDGCVSKKWIIVPIVCENSVGELFRPSQRVAAGLEVNYLIVTTMEALSPRYNYRSFAAVLPSDYSRHTRWTLR